MSVYRFTMCYNHSLILRSHAIIVWSPCRIPNLHLIKCTYYPMVLLFYMVECTFHFVLLKKTFNWCFSFYTIFSSYTFHLYAFHSYTCFHSYTFFHSSTFNSYIFHSHTFLHSYTFHSYTFHSYTFHSYTFH